jgi:prepilin-type N-terminal cleavage/methylation domain-containing protein
MNIKRKHINKGFTLVELLVVIAIIAALAAMATPVIMKQQKKAAMITATSNAKQVFMLMVEFDQDYYSFPNTVTETTLAAEGITGTMSGSANGYLKQLILGGYTTSEEIFFAKDGSQSASIPPDDDIATNAATLKAGECGFAYIADLSSGKNTGLPLMCAPMQSTTTFKSDPYGGKCVVLRIDGAVKQYRIKKPATGSSVSDGVANIGGGKTLFTSTIWTNAQSGSGANFTAPKVYLAD